MGHERTRSCTTIDRLQHGSLHFDKAMLIKECPQGLDDGCALAKYLAHLRVHCQVGIALSGAQFRVFQRGVADDCTIFERLILRCGERADGFGKQFEVVDMQRHFARLRAEHYPPCLNEVTYVEHLVEKIQALFSQLVRAKEELHFPCTIFNVRKGDLTHGAAGTDASRQSDLDLQC